MPRCSRSFPYGIVSWFGGVSRRDCPDRGKMWWVGSPPRGIVPYGAIWMMRDVRVRYCPERDNGKSWDPEHRGVGAHLAGGAAGAAAATRGRGARGGGRNPICVRARAREGDGSGGAYAPGDGGARSPDDG